MKKITLFLIFTSLQIIGYAQNVEQLLVGEIHLKVITLGSSDQYNVDLKKGQFGLINLKQIGIDVKIITYSPNGESLDEFDSPNGSSGHEIAVIDANESGLYKLKIVPIGENKKEKKGAYKLQLVALNDNVSTHLDESFKLINDRGYLPGFFVSILNEQEILYSNGQGYANIEKQIPYTINTIQQIESISKTFISLALMKLVEEGKLDLDTNINQYLPFKVIHPKFPKTAITLRHLATHTASINDGDKIEEAFWMENKDLYLKNRDKYLHKSIRKELDDIADNEQPISMENFLKAFFISKEKFYSKKNFLKNEPGKSWYYSNVGATLAAYIVERLSGQQYDEFVLEHIITPLKLENTTWGFNPERSNIHALKYDGGKTEYPRGIGALYPDGGIYTNTDDLSKYLMEWMKGYYEKGILLKPSSYKEIMKLSFEEKKGRFKGIKNGLFWWIFKGNRMGHNGGNYGSNANMFFYPEMGIGYTSLENMMLNDSEKASIQSAHIREMIRRYIKYFRKN